MYSTPLARFLQCMYVYLYVCGVFGVQLDAWTESHETQEAARLKAQQEAMGEDGWTVVVRSKVRLAFVNIHYSTNMGCRCTFH